MIVDLLHRGVRLGLDKNSYLPIPSFEPEEIDYWLNKAQDAYVDKCIDALTDINTSEEEKKRCQEVLSPLYKFLGYQAVDVLNYTTLSVNAWKCPSTGTAPLNTRRITDVYVKLNRTLEDGTSVTNQTVPCKFIPITEINKYMYTPFNRVYFEMPAYTFIEYNSSDKGFLIFSDSQTSTISMVLASYFENPRSIDITTSTTSELPEVAHQKIIDLAVTLMIENIESERVQTQPLINKTL